MIRSMSGGGVQVHKNEKCTKLLEGLRCTEIEKCTKFEGSNLKGRLSPFCSRLEEKAPPFFRLAGYEPNPLESPPWIAG